MADFVISNSAESVECCGENYSCFKQHYCLSCFITCRPAQLRKAMGTDNIYMENTLTPDDIIARYNEKLKLYCDNIDPYSLDVSECSEAIADLPNITTHQIQSYLMLSKCPYSGKHGERSLDYQNSAETGQVTKIYTKNFDDITIVLGEILIPETGEYFNPWFVSFPYGYVLCAHCSCVSGTNEMCIHIGGLLHRVQTLKVHCSNDSTPLEKISTTTETLATVRNCNESTESSGQLRKCHRMKRKKRVKMYVCGICMSQFSDKVTFMNHCQQNHTLPEFLSSNNHKRKRNKQTNVNTTVNDRSGIYSKHIPQAVHSNAYNEMERAGEIDVTLEEDRDFHSDVFDHNDERVFPASELPVDIIDLDNFIGADEMSVDEFLLARRPYETTENGTVDSTKLTEFNAIEVADDVLSLAEHSDKISAISDRTEIMVSETLLIKQEPDLIIIDEDLEALEQLT